MWQYVQTLNILIYYVLSTRNHIVNFHGKKEVKRLNLASCHTSLLVESILGAKELPLGSGLMHLDFGDVDKASQIQN